ncbi:hypothetical protein ACQP10_28255 [Streptosporangium sandarakinum]|uniref:hypothetical protein n=1 Tax=Streptosporangium sandarakinum TaxID=1260955 RepID=UPI003D8ECD60
MREPDMARPAGRAAARDAFEQVRMRYFRLRPPLRRLIHVAVLVAAAGLALGMGWSLLFALPATIALLGFVSLALRYPRAAATVAVVAAWMLTLPIFQAVFGASAAPVAMMLLALPVAGLAHVVRWVPPWLTTLMALAAAGVVAVAAGTAVPGAAVWTAYGAAAAVLVYRFVQARRAKAALDAAEGARGRDGPSGPNGSAAGRGARRPPRPPAVPRRRRSRWSRRSASWTP